MTMLFRIAMQAAFGFCTLVALGSMGSSIFLFYHMLRLTPAMLKEEQPIVLIARKVGMWSIVLSALIMIIGIGSLLF